MGYKQVTYYETSEEDVLVGIPAIDLVQRISKKLLKNGIKHSVHPIPQYIGDDFEFTTSFVIE